MDIIIKFSSINVWSDNLLNKEWFYKLEITIIISAMHKTVNKLLIITKSLQHVYYTWHICYMN